MRMAAAIVKYTKVECALMRIVRSGHDTWVAIVNNTLEDSGTAW